MLRIHRSRFAWGNAEERRTELVDVLNEAAPLRVHLAWRVLVRIEVGVDVPAVFGDFRDGVAAACQQVPESSRTIHPARESARHADHRDRLRFGALQYVELGPQVADFPQSFFHQGRFVNWFGGSHRAFPASSMVFSSCANRAAISSAVRSSKGSGDSFEDSTGGAGPGPGPCMASSKKCA